MKLTDPWFEAEFIGEVSERGSFRRLSSIDGAQGLMLVSPCGAGGPRPGVHSVIVAFANPRNAPRCRPTSFRRRAGR